MVDMVERVTQRSTEGLAPRQTVEDPVDGCDDRRDIPRSGRRVPDQAPWMLGRDCRRGGAWLATTEKFSQPRHEVRAPLTAAARPGPIVPSAAF